MKPREERWKEAHHGQRFKEGGEDDEYKNPAMH